MKILLYFGTIYASLLLIVDAFGITETNQNFLSNNQTNEETGIKEHKYDYEFYHASVSSFTVIIVSEIGDKTWFIAAIMAMRHSRCLVFSGAITALIFMTVLSACLGWILQIIPHKVTFYISTILLIIFGVKMLQEGYYMSNNESAEEYEEANAEVQKTTLELDSDKYRHIENGEYDNRTLKWSILNFVSIIFAKSFILTFFAEWGDRSQMATVILAARDNVFGIILGAALGHFICTGIAVIFGRILAQRISVKTVTVLGGIVFLIFAISTLLLDDEL